MMRALILGSAGQDGTLLFERLERDGFDVAGFDTLVSRTSPGLSHARDALTQLRLGDPSAVSALVREVAPDAVYYLAALHHSSEEALATAPVDTLRAMFDVHVHGLTHVLEGMRLHAPEAHLFYAASSHVFGDPAEATQNELTPLRPTSPYAITKVAGMHVCRYYRELGVRASVGILYNHESRARRGAFVSRKIVDGARSAKQAVGRNERAPLVLGNLDAIVDWGWAPDYVDAMVRMTRASAADDYVIATGVPHTVRDFARAAYEAVGLDYREHVQEDASVLRRRVPSLVGDASKLRRALSWAPTITFEQMVSSLVLE